MENLLISACLLGMKCRYDGKDNKITYLDELKRKYHLIPVCPEVYGGLGTPRLPSEISGGRVINKAGADMSAYFEKGAEEALLLARMFHCRLALFKERSPSCGGKTVYDGTFQGRLTEGSGIAALLLAKNGIKIIGESEGERLLFSEDF